MGLHTTDIIVLRKYPFRETSVVISCLSDRFGKLKGLVKGLRQQPNRYHSAMEPLTVNRIVFYDTLTSSLHLISQCDLLDPLDSLQRDLETMRTAAHCVDLADTVLALEEPQPLIYQLLRDTLGRLSLDPSGRVLLRVHFVTRLLRLIGFQPQLDTCVGCGTSVEVEEGFWSVSEGGLLCVRCHSQDPRAESVNPETLKALKLLAQSDAPVAMDDSLVQLLSRRLDAFLQWRLDRPLKTLSIR